MLTDWLLAPDYSISRLLIGRGLAAIYLIGFLVAARQFRPLLGERGLLPVPRFVAAVPFISAPSLFQWHYSDRVLGVVAWSGAAIAALMLLGLPQAVSLPLTMLAWIVLWALYLSIVNVGQTFYAFGWESLLLEAGFLAIFLGSEAYAPSALVILLYRWLAFRVEFGAGLIKMRGDRCWRDLTCLDYHHETQPMPNPLSWYFHRLPRRGRPAAAPLHRRRHRTAPPGRRPELPAGAQPAGTAPAHELLVQLAAHREHLRCVRQRDPAPGRGDRGRHGRSGPNRRQHLA